MIQKCSARIKSALALLAISSAAFAGQSPLPFDLGGNYTLTDQNGELRTQADPEDKLQLLFFGYANCLQICSAALPLMGDIVREVETLGTSIQPIMITVDPARDTPESIGAPLAEYHPDFIGLTGSDDALQVAYDAFSVEKEEIFFDPEYGPVFSHGSFIYLLDAQGGLLTLIPPILDTDTATKIVTKYITERKS
ncbi:MAG: SCO family protein [Litoreibacter sp.]